MQAHTHKITGLDILALMVGGETRRGLSKSCALLILIAGIERYAFKGVASNLVTYLTDEVKMSNSRAATTVNTWSGFTFMLPLFSAPFADTYWDRFFTILASSSLYFVGLVGLTFTAYAKSRSTTKTISLYFLYTSLCLVALGLGVLNPSLQAFGADQLDHDLDQDQDHEQSSENKEVKSNRKTQFFQWWYFGVCAGSLLGVTVMAYIQDTFGWVLGFAIPTASMLLLILLFLCGCGVYVYADPNLDPKAKPFQRIFDLIKERVCRRSKITLVNNHDLNAMELELQEKPLCNCSSTETTSTNKNLADEKSCKSGFSGLETVKLLLRLLPIWMMLLMFAVIFQQPATFFTKQGMTMKRNIGPNFKIPPATLQSTITLSIILLMPLYDKVLIPIAKKMTKNEKGISVMERMGIGMFLSIIAIVIAALVERKRLKISRTSPSSEPLSIFWLLPQYILLGISDIFTVVGMQEFFYSEVPVRMRTMGFALYTSVFGVGSFVSAALISIIESYTSSRGGKHNWFADDMSEARLDNYYWLLALTSAISFLIISRVVVMMTNVMKNSRATMDRPRVDKVGTSKEQENKDGVIKGRNSHPNPLGIITKQRIRESVLLVVPRRNIVLYCFTYSHVTSLIQDIDVASLKKSTDPSGKSLTLPKFCVGHNVGPYVESILGFDPINKQYKEVLSMTPLAGFNSEDSIIPYREHKVFTLGAQGTWTMVKCNSIHCPGTISLCINGVVYYDM
ncbi:unnamed protein product [Thlaspi arvense]|uniref:F-box associated beta-propeller type 3 domain-containing protein n=1 Tax=Thlaspi arvense TaxID=13288 RepID=A0AAU9SYF4_THLAR|nr:unnamed protein product [Thlaspi arvense]